MRYRIASVITTALVAVLLLSSAPVAALTLNPDLCQGNNTGSCPQSNGQFDCGQEPVLFPWQRSGFKVSAATGALDSKSTATKAVVITLAIRYLIGTSPHSGLARTEQHPCRS